MMAKFLLCGFGLLMLYMTAGTLHHAGSSGAFAVPLFIAAFGVVAWICGQMAESKSLNNIVARTSRHAENRNGAKVFPVGREIQQRSKKLGAEDRSLSEAAMAAAIFGGELTGESEEFGTSRLLDYSQDSPDREDPREWPEAESFSEERRQDDESTDSHRSEMLQNLDRIFGKD